MGAVFWFAFQCFFVSDALVQCFGNGVKGRMVPLVQGAIRSLRMIRKIRISSLNDDVVPFLSQSNVA